MIMNKDYWVDYYQRIGYLGPSDFAKFCVDRFIRYYHHVVDAGCGDGRDLRYFEKFNFKVSGIDCVPNPNPNVIVQDIGEAKFNCDVVYSRWMLHAIDKETEDNFLRNVYDGISLFGLLCIECRSDTDDRAPILDNHYRRHINFERLKEKMIALGFKIIYAGEQRGWSVQDNDDPLLIRIIARKIV